MRLAVFGLWAPIVLFAFVEVVVGFLDFLFVVSKFALAEVVVHQVLSVPS